MVYFELTRIDNLQDYIPIIHELDRRGYNYSFIIRKNKKEWNSIYNFFDTKELFKFTDNVIEYDSIESTNIGGVIFCTNGDIKINSSNTTL